MSGPSCCHSLAADFSQHSGWDIHDTTYTRELTISNRANGYRDILARIDLATFRRIPWENNIPFFLVSFLNPDDQTPLHACPRSMLEVVTGKLADKGWTCMAGAEYEYFQFRETAESVASKRFHDLQALTPGMHGYSMLRPSLNQDYFHELYDAAEAFGIEVEGHREQA